MIVDPPKKELAERVQPSSTDTSGSSADALAAEAQWFVVPAGVDPDLGSDAPTLRQPSLFFAGLITLILLAGSVFRQASVNGERTHLQ